MYLGKPAAVHVEAAVILAQFHRQGGPARQAYRPFLREGLRTGHHAQDYETGDQRFVGDERFREEIQRKTDARHAVTVKGPKVTFPASFRPQERRRATPGTAWFRWGGSASGSRLAHCWCSWRGSGVGSGEGLGASPASRPIHDQSPVCWRREEPQCVVGEAEISQYSHLSLTPFSL